MRVQRFAMAGALLAAVLPFASSQMTAVFGPKRYARVVGPQQTFVEMFPHSAAGQPCRLVVTKGEDATASVSLNSSLIAGPSDFNSRLARIVKPVALADENRLEVRLTSQPGTFVTIEVECGAPSAPGSANVSEATAPSHSVSGGGFPHQPLNFPGTVNRPRWTVPAVGMTNFDTKPSGLRIHVDGGEPRVAPFSLSLSAGGHTVETATTQAGSEGTRYVFTGWSDGGAASHEIAAGAGATSYTATFATQYLLSVSAIPAGGGSIRVTPPSSDRSSYYDAGAKLTLTARPNASYVFSGFEGTVTGRDNPQTVTLTGPSLVVAKFTARQ